MHAVNMVMCGLCWCKTVAIGMFAMLQKKLVEFFINKDLTSLYWVEMLCVAGKWKASSYGLVRVGLD